MLSIYAITDLIPAVEAIIDSEDRLSELVQALDSLETAPQHSGHSLIVDSRGILQPIDWQNARPPYLLANPLPFEKDLLLGLLFSKLGNDEKAWNYLTQYPKIQQEINIISRLQHGYQIKLAELKSLMDATEPGEFEQYRIRHNMAVLQHYGYLDETPDVRDIRYFYQEAMNMATNEEYKAFSCKHLA